MRHRLIPVIAVAVGVALLPISPGNAEGERVSDADAKALAQVMPRAGVASDSIYFVMTDRYANGNPANDQGAGASQGGFDPTSAVGFHGGDFVGMSANLERLKRLGFTAIWVTPPVSQNAVQGNSTAYHGYWGLDFTTTDPHLGTEAEFAALVAKAQGMGIKVYVDVVLNHTGDIIRYQDGYGFVPQATKPYRDGEGKSVDLGKVAGLPLCTGVSTGTCFPLLSGSSFPKDAYIPVGYQSAKKPNWLNDITLYHNRGDANACNWAPGECAEMGDFFGLDDIMTEHPSVAPGWAEVIASWITRFKIDGIRIDTAKHVDPTFFKRWVPLMVKAAADAGKPDFAMFGEAWETTPESLATYVRDKDLPSVLDFGLQPALVAYASGKRSGKSFLRLFARDDWFNAGERQDGVVRNAYSLVTFVGNHDMGRGAWLIAGASQSKGSALTRRVQLAHSVLYLSRGAPTVYYGDEVGMIGSGGDSASRQDMFPTKVSAWQKEARLGSTPIGSGSSLSRAAESLPLAKQIAGLAALRRAHPALVSGAFIPREGYESVASWSRVLQSERREYIVLANAGAKATTITVSTSTPNSGFLSIYGGAKAVTSKADGTIKVKVPALTTVVYRAVALLPATKAAVVLSSESYWDDLVGAPIVRVNSRPVSDPLTVSFVARDCPTCAWKRLGSDDAPPYQMVIPRGTVDLTKPFQVAAIALTSDGQRFGGLVYTTDPADFQF